MTDNGRIMEVIFSGIGARDTCVSKKNQQTIKDATSNKKSKV